MTEQDEPRLKEIMNRVGVIADKAMTPEHYDTYFELLKDFSIEQVAGAFTHALKKNTFFPRPAELIGILEGKDDDRASYAWAAFLDAASSGGYPSVKFLDPATATAMDVVFGGWVQACRLLAAGWTDDHGKDQGGRSDEMVASDRNQFQKVYAAARRSPRHVETYRPGLSELSMREGGEGWKDRMGTLIQPVLLVGEKQTKAINLPFDVAAGILTGEAMARLSAGPRVAVAFAEQFTPKGLVANPERKALRAAPQPPATKEEIAAILAGARAKHQDSPKALENLRALEDAA